MSLNFIIVAYYQKMLIPNVNKTYIYLIKKISDQRYLDSKNERKRFIDFSLCNTLKIKPYQLNNMYHLEFDYFDNCARSKYGALIF